VEAEEHFFSQLVQVDPVTSNGQKNMNKEHTTRGSAHTKGHKDAAIRRLVKEQTFSKY
jgi:hypothetical protein